MANAINQVNTLSGSPGYCEALFSVLTWLGRVSRVKITSLYFEKFSQFLAFKERYKLSKGDGSTVNCLYTIPRSSVRSPQTHIKGLRVVWSSIILVLGKQRQEGPWKWQNQAPSSKETFYLKHSHQGLESQYLGGRGRQIFMSGRSAWFA